MKTNALIVGAAMAGLMTGSLATSASAATRSSNQNINAGTALQTLADTKDTHGCKGANSCKGSGGCKSGDNGCKGKNSCKGKGGCATDGSKPTPTPK